MCSWPVPRWTKVAFASSYPYMGRRRHSTRSRPDSRWRIRPVSWTTSHVAGRVHVGAAGGGTSSSTSWYCGSAYGISIFFSTQRRFFSKGQNEFTVFFFGHDLHTQPSPRKSGVRRSCRTCPQILLFLVATNNQKTKMSDTDWYNNKCGTRSLVVVPRTHKAPLKEPETARGVNWDVCRNDEGLAAKAVLVDPRPRRRDCLATLVLWNSRTVHCNGHFGRGKKRARSTGAYSPVVTQGDTSLLPTMPGSHFWRSKGTRWWNCPWKRIPHERLLRLYREAVQLVNRDVVDASFPNCPRFETITAEHLPPYKTKGLQQFYGFASTPFADEARLDPEVRAVFAAILRRGERRHVLFPRRARDCPGEGEERELAPPGPDLEPVLSKERGFVVGARVPLPETAERLPKAGADGGVAPGRQLTGDEHRTWWTL